jgi:predicted metal-binding membrane protein
MYLIVWAITGIGLILALSISISNVPNLYEHNNISEIFGSILIVYGIYQFSSLKNKCLGYCESPSSFFMRQWKNGKIGTLKMGIYHGLYCLGCCWPYFLIMVSLGWMNIGWMALFSLIIFFGEKMWSRGIWISKLVEMTLIKVGFFGIVGVISLYNGNMNMTTNPSMNMDMNTIGNMKDKAMRRNISFERF